MSAINLQPSGHRVGGRRLPGHCSPAQLLSEERLDRSQLVRGQLAAQVIHVAGPGWLAGSHGRKPAVQHGGRHLHLRALVLQD
jgi:hypothetical protein